MHTSTPPWQPCAKNIGRQEDRGRGSHLSYLCLGERAGLGGQNGASGQPVRLCKWQACVALLPLPTSYVALPAKAATPRLRSSQCALKPRREGRKKHLLVELRRSKRQAVCQQNLRWLGDSVQSAHLLAHLCTLSLDGGDKAAL